MRRPCRDEVRALTWGLLTTAAVAACNVAPPPPSTGGVTFGDTEAGTDGGADPTPLDDAADGRMGARTCD